MGWHHTYQIQCGGHWHISCFQSKPQHKHRHFDVHAGQLRRWSSTVMDTEVLVFKSRSEERARRLTAGLAFVQKMMEDQQQTELKKSLAVVQGWTMKVDSVEYFLGQRKTVHKEDTVVVLERQNGVVIVDYDDACDDISQLRQEHPVLADVVELSGRRSGGRRVVSCLRATLVSGVYHLTFVAFRCGSDSQSRHQSQDNVTLEEPDGCTFHQPLVPTAPEALEPTAPELEAVEPTAPEPEEQEMLEPTAPEQEDVVPQELESEEDDPPPPYSECLDSSEGIQGLPPYQRYEDPPPPYQAIER